MLGVALAGLVTWALFSEGATSLEDGAGLQIVLCAAASSRSRGCCSRRACTFGRRVQALIGLGLLVLFAAWSGVSIGWSIAPDLSWVQLNRWAAYALVVALALVLGSSLRRAPERTAIAFLIVATAIAVYALGGKVVPWFSIPGLIDLDQTADFSRLRAPLGYWNALGLVCVLAGPIAVRTGGRPRSVAAAAHVLARRARAAARDPRAHLFARRHPGAARRPGRAGRDRPRPAAARALQRASAWPRRCPHTSWPSCATT